eukprot:37897-Chlamydomonas_euryale.AAC.6
MRMTCSRAPRRASPCSTPRPRPRRAGTYPPSCAARARANPLACDNRVRRRARPMTQATDGDLVPPRQPRDGGGAAGQSDSGGATSPRTGGGSELMRHRALGRIMNHVLPGIITIVSVDSDVPLLYQNDASLRCVTCGAQ